MYYDNSVERLVKWAVLFAKKQPVCVKKHAELPNLPTAFWSLRLVTAIVV